jgi:hypothetical protein
MNSLPSMRQPRMTKKPNAMRSRQPAGGSSMNCRTLATVNIMMLLSRACGCPE